MSRRRAQPTAGEEGRAGEADGAGATRGCADEMPERLFRQGDDWAWLQAARRERRRDVRRARIETLAGAAREHRPLVLALAAPAAMLGLAWLLGAVR